MIEKQRPLLVDLLKKSGLYSILENFKQDRVQRCIDNINKDEEENIIDNNNAFEKFISNFKNDFITEIFCNTSKKQ
jgi:hypothetical protein